MSQPNYTPNLINKSHILLAAISTLAAVTSLSLAWDSIAETEELNIQKLARQNIALSERVSALSTSNDRLKDTVNSLKIKIDFLQKTPATLLKDVDSLEEKVRLIWNSSQQNFELINRVDEKHSRQ
ncbi:hypothetical protein [Shewanella atlantica]|uniref:Uncharacterized protein n=1 Tax=Shewanella atlantica TaxID=271099 RepID=A0A431VUW7_9GAMM|nr:hypothetical protein [Shewanella atlantica]RTR27004.1 hypothetical protein EKG39_21065 [Shewanella atlantica]